VQRMAHPTKSRRSMQRHSSTRCQPLELRFLAGGLVKFGREGDQLQSQANVGKKAPGARRTNSQSGSVPGPILAT
jgi:hypothetical protein